MDHDPLCPVIPADRNFSDWGCQCALIRKVRADSFVQAANMLRDEAVQPSLEAQAWAFAYAEYLSSHAESLRGES